MRLRDIVRQVVVDARKLTDYTLDPENPIGRHKAEVFERRWVSPKAITRRCYDRLSLVPWMLTPICNALTSMDNIIVSI